MTDTSERRRATLKVLLENPYLLNPPKTECQNDKKEDGWVENFDVTAAFLGPTLWSKTLPFDGGEFKVDYMDLDEFFNENESKDRREFDKKSVGTSDDDGSCCSSLNESCTDQGPEIKHALATFPGKEFDPSNKRFTENELKPQPMFKKCKKQLVPNDMKDDRYWARRQKNNVAAKRSRDARRIKENQIVMRAAYLEKENHLLKKEMDVLRQENQSLLAKLHSMGC